VSGISAAGRLIAESLSKGGSFYVHDAERMTSWELIGRAGGLPAVKELNIWDLPNLKSHPEDVVVFFSSSKSSEGESSLIEALRDRRMKVIGVLPKKGRGKEEDSLMKHSEITIDNGLDGSGGVVPVQGFKEKLGPIDSIVNPIVGFAICAEVIDQLLARGLKPSVYMSVRRQGSRERNTKMLRKYTEQGF
jgi:uncharacterized phosphosugar-binding protein